MALGLFLFGYQNKPIMLKYENYGSKFKIDYPNDWERSSKINNETIFIAPKESDSASSPAGLVIKVISMKSNKASIDSISNALISQLKNSHKDFKLESNVPIKIGNLNANQIIFTAADSNLQLRKALQIITLDNNKLFIITYKASIDKYLNYENIMKDMVGSFKFLQ